MQTSPANSFDLRHCVPMTRAEEQSCATEYAKTRAPLLAERLVMANMRLVVTIAQGYRRSGSDMRDLVQEGNRGLMHAVARFDPERGIKLCSYAAWWIRAYILKFNIDNWCLVKVGTTQAQRKMFFGLNKVQRKLEKAGFQADSGRLASAMGIKEREVVEMLERLGGGETSLDAPRRNRGAEGSTIGDSLSAAPTLRPDVRFEASEFSAILQRKLKAFEDTLGARDLDVLRRRLLSETPVTLAVLAAEFGVSRERTRQVETVLRARLRDYLKREMGDALEPSAAAA